MFLTYQMSINNIPRYLILKYLLIGYYSYIRWHTSRVAYHIRIVFSALVCKSLVGFVFTVQKLRRADNTILHISGNIIIRTLLLRAIVRVNVKQIAELAKSQKRIKIFSREYERRRCRRNVSRLYCWRHRKQRRTHAHTHHTHLRHTRDKSQVARPDKHAKNIRADLSVPLFDNKALLARESHWTTTTTTIF